MAPNSLQIGLTRGLIELRQSFSPTGLVGHLFWPVATLAAVVFLRDRDVPGAGLALGALVVPGVLGMFVAFGVLLVIQYLAADREDGTLLRAKTMPGGITGYLVGKLVTVSATILAYLVVLLVAGAFLVDGLELGRPGSWLTLAWVLLLGLAAMLFIGAVLGALVSNPRATGYLSVLVMGLAGISGIFYPIIALPHWLQWVAQVFPMYWLGLGMRSALLPGGAAAVEIGESWRHLETVAVLGAWALLGLIVAPIVLRRMARKESGSRMTERREKALQRVG
jgi:ABC-2 type transport system permease protein